MASNLATYPGDTLATAFGLGSFGSGVAQGTLQSVVATGAQITNVSVSGIQYPGNTQDPGHRDIPIALENSVAPGPGGGAIEKITYGFPTQYGTDPISGSPLFNQITAQQNRTRKTSLGVTPNTWACSSSSSTRAVPPPTSTWLPAIPGAGPDARPSEVAGIASLGGGLAIINSFDNWSSDASEYGGGWMTVAMHEIGHSLNFFHDDASPPLTIMNGGTNRAVPVRRACRRTWPGASLPGDVDIVNGQHIMRPDANDINMYQFTVANPAR